MLRSEVQRFPDSEALLCCYKGTWTILQERNRVRKVHLALSSLHHTRVRRTLCRTRTQRQQLHNEGSSSYGVRRA